MGRRTVLTLILLATAAGAFLGAAPLTSAHAADIEATEWRAGDRDPGTRLVVELSESVPFKVSGEVDPLRVFIDLPGVISRLPGRLAALGVIANADAEAHGDGTRITVTLDRPVKVAQAFILEPSEGKPYRLVVDFVPASRQAFVAALVPGAAEARPAPTPKPAPLPKAEPKAKAAAEPPPAAALPPPSKPEAAAPPPAATEPAPSAPAPAAAQQTAPPPPPAIASPSAPAFGAPSVDEPPPPLPGQTIREPGKPPTVIVPLPSPPPPASDAPPAPKSSALTDGKIMVAIDPGHGGIDPGATGRDGVHEKVITLATAQAVKQALEETGRYQVLLTRADDTSVHLRERVARARLAGAQLFISIHADVLSDRTITGLSVYTLSDTATDREAEALAAKENKADVINGVDLTASSPEVSTILIDLAQRETNTLSDVLAERLVKEIAGTAPELPKAHRSAGFAVLTAPDIPSVLIELGYLSNDKEAKRLESVDERKRLAVAIARAVDRYFQARMLQRS